MNPEAEKFVERTTQTLQEYIKRNNIDPDSLEVVGVFESHPTGDSVVIHRFTAYKRTEEPTDE